jgi:hypothetical protein
MQLGCSLHPYDAQSGIKVHVDVQDQAIRPCLECAKVSYGFRTNWHVSFNLDSHVVAVAYKKFFHVLDCVDRMLHVSSRAPDGSVFSMI